MSYLLIYPSAAPAKAVLTAADFEYVGAQKIPDVEGTGNMPYAFPGLAMRKVGGVLHFFLAGRGGQYNTADCTGQYVHEIVSQGFDPVLASAPTATLYHSWEDIYQGHKTTTGSEQGAGVPTLGLWWDEELGALFWTYGIYYRIITPNQAVMGCTVLSEGAPWTKTSYGPWKTGVDEKTVRDAVLRLPAWFVAACGLGSKTLGMGATLWSGNATCSWGPSLIAVEKPTLATAPGTELAAQQLAFFENNEAAAYDTAPATIPPATVRVCRRDANYSCPDDKGFLPDGSTGFWQMDDRWHACAFIDLPDKYGVWYGGYLSHGQVWYGGPNDFPPGDVADQEGTGPHSEGRYVRWWIHDPARLQEVALGTRSVWDLTPTVIDPASIDARAPFWHDGCGWGITGVGGPSMAGAVFDPDTRNLYFVARNALTGRAPVLHCWHIKE